MRYIWRDIYASLIAITLILLAIFITNQFSHFLKMAANGHMSIPMAVKLVGFQIPILLTYLLPLAFYLSILIAFGRLYIDHEMTVMTVCGMSLFRQIRIVLSMALMVAAVAAWLTLWAVPALQHRAYQMRSVFASQFKLQTLVPKQFNPFSKADVIYFEKLDHHTNMAKNLFLAVRKPAKTPGLPSKWDVVVAHTAHAEKVPYDTGKYIVSRQGYRYSGTPGQLNYQVFRYGENGVDVASALLGKSGHHHLSHKKAIYGMSSMTLWRIHRQDPIANAELQLRLAVPISVFIIALLAMGLCQVDPRRGKFFYVIPAILLYVFYADMIFLSRAWLQRGLLPADVGMWWIHGVMLVIVCILLLRQIGWQRLRLYWQRPKEVSACTS